MWIFCCCDCTRSGIPHFCAILFIVGITLRFENFLDPALIALINPCRLITSYDIYNMPHALHMNCLTVTVYFFKAYAAVFCVFSLLVELN